MWFIEVSELSIDNDDDQWLAIAIVESFDPPENLLTRLLSTLCPSSWCLPHKLNWNKKEQENFHMKSRRIGNRPASSLSIS